MAMTYIQFDEPINPIEASKEGAVKRTLKKVFIGIIEKVIPKANPDFESKIASVVRWMLELETETGIPQREIGIDKEGEVIMIMPFKNNYGYWTDNNLLLNDFITRFNAAEISIETFERLWNAIDKNV